MSTMNALDIQNLKKAYGENVAVMEQASPQLFIVLPALPKLPVGLFMFLVQMW